MNTEEQFLLNKLRCELAMQQALQSWHPKPRVFGIECPRCKSDIIGKHGTIKGVQKYICKSCHRTFIERAKLVCDCLIPGQQLKCQRCPQFKEFLEIVKERMANGSE
ncbi:MAG TPA: hypothetical protein VK203_10025 [Nostocaceae cyanobacterium]|nr:hypothetical protein [Nostocaceae cyanobacterium]